MAFAIGTGKSRVNLHSSVFIAGNFLVTATTAAVGTILGPGFAVAKGTGGTSHVYTVTPTDPAFEVLWANAEMINLVAGDNDNLTCRVAAMTGTSVQFEVLNDAGAGSEPNAATDAEIGAADRLAFLILVRNDDIDVR